ncbi:hypothetical protein [Nocardioides sp.]|uniref:hypothetical protein n=1 Tax=Nocardioides sp. TaxID=35761 RepID=UPI0027336A54|nr:hypothetical protein [Nocardioides sp.]MDP3894882.1 hypothetical protein [Nocardioides sp.]
MSEYGTERDLDDPVEVDGETTEAGSVTADHTTVSEETGTLYGRDGDTEATPEDEERLLEETGEDA